MKPIRRRSTVVSSSASKEVSVVLLYFERKKCLNQRHLVHQWDASASDT